MQRTFVFVCILSAAAFGCKKPTSGGDDPPKPDASEDAGAPPTDPPVGFGTIRGKITYAGTPEMRPLQTGSDPFCAQHPQQDESLLVASDKGLKNVVVRLKDSPEGEHGPWSGTIDLLQDGCKYVPHIQAVQAGATIRITNGDRTLHNVHTFRKNGSTWFNQAQPPGVPPLEKRLNELDQVIKFKCDVHPWMTAFVVVVDHPYFAVTGDDGTFTMRVPAGRHSLVLWHEKYGDIVIDDELDVTADDDVSVNVGLPSR